MRLTQIIEALLFASDAPLTATDLSKVDERLDEDTVEAVIQELRAEYEVGERSFQIYEVAGGYQLLTRPDFVAVLERYDSVPQPSRLSAPALEVLAIIAYRQPLGRAEIEDIRGVGSSGVLRTLVDRSLVEPVGRGEGLGRPLLYGTTAKFLEHFGFRSLEDLPRPDELPVVLRERPSVEAGLRLRLGKRRRATRVQPRTGRFRRRSGCWERGGSRPRRGGCRCCRN
jgi:segregation and condensation protein B